MNTITTPTNSQLELSLGLSSAIEAFADKLRVAMQRGQMDHETYLQAHEDLNRAIDSANDLLGQAVAVQDVIRFYSEDK